MFCIINRKRHFPLCEKTIIHKFFVCNTFFLKHFFVENVQQNRDCQILFSSLMELLKTLNWREY
jgi:hypothetical protein